MFVTRAGRHDKTDLKEFIEKARGTDADTSAGTAMIAREGIIIGCVRLIEVDPKTLVFDDVLVADDRDEDVAKQLIQAALNNKGGTVYATVPDAQTGLFEEFGFARIECADAPSGVRAYWDDRHARAEGSSCMRAR